MQGVKGIEEFLSDFLRWYNGFLSDLNHFRIEAPESEAFTAREGISRKYDSLQIFNDGIYHIFTGHSSVTVKGTLPELVEREEQLASKIQELEARYGRKAIPYFEVLNGMGHQRRREFIPLPQYGLFITGLEFPAQDDGIGIAAQIVYNQFAEDFARYNLGLGVMLAFGSGWIVKLPKLQTSSTLGLCAEHPQYDLTLFVRIAAPMADVVCVKAKKAVADYNDDAVLCSFRTKIRQASDSFVLSQRICVYQKHIGTGAYTALLDMLEAKPAVPLQTQK